MKLFRMLPLPPDIEFRLLQAVQAATRVTTDTRHDLEGAMFWALKGERFDANQFVEEALERGVSHVVTTDAHWRGHANVTVVADVLSAMQWTARAYRRTWTATVLALTGSNGKTTSKELIRDVLATSHTVHATPGNYNNHIGVPLTLLNAPQPVDIVIVEMGANHRGEIALLCDIAEPTMGYITNIGLAHLEGFGGEEGVFKGKKELFDSLAQSGGTAFVLQTDAKVVRAAQELNSIIPVSDEGWAWSDGDGINPQAPAALVTSPWCPQGFVMHLEGRYNLSNCISAATIGEHFGISHEAIQRALSAYVPNNHRSQGIQTDRNWVLLDAYNANPSSTRHALEAFHLRAFPQPLVILGSMAELGEASLSLHLEIVELAQQCQLPLWTVGQEFGHIPHLGRHFSTTEELMAELDKAPLQQREILIKGSRGMGLEKLMPYL
ncbi:MAG: UDP-N-acetylmuramoyl-tripeptide--D-alanyl-D-alanine ligase [Bacteroidetes bacterium]|nr:UDP-N-acetylmuramoyl-tripeptide--D-alanyl-D-alanine ligase [Bacteroidota bacterium]MDA0902928.1 UDP-N-acetylmuramoyl-tripeptide--D-alanyl-D-alanine ligase [Bacteroidota bacterium]MDA1241656.1 UDP-N-acetylmuramoyl-tripeptide--D-alanyl-D-alanine ligase [Bacteroidota bacterium]